MTQPHKSLREKAEKIIDEHLTEDTLEGGFFYTSTPKDFIDALEALLKEVYEQGMRRGMTRKISRLSGFEMELSPYDASQGGAKVMKKG